MKKYFYLWVLLGATLLACGSSFLTGKYGGGNIIWYCSGCSTKPPVGPTTLGGSSGTGGTSAITGGNVSTGGTATTGGNSATGGSSQFAWIAPTCPNGMMASGPKDAHERHLTGWLPNPKRMRGHAVRMQAAFVPWSCFHMWNDSTNPDQDGVGACTGFGVENALSFAPFTLHATNKLGLAIYSAATKIDNGCAWNATKCTGSYPPNDPGSTGASALQAALSMQAAGQIPKGTFSGYSTADTFEQMLQEVTTKGTCVIGTYWKNSQMTAQCGSPLTVDFNSGNAGGHERAIVGLEVHFTQPMIVDENNSYVIEDNSWGDTWGECYGKRCGLHRIRFADERKLLADQGEIDCPDP